MHAYVRMRHGEAESTLCPGDLVGRHAACALQLDDPRVSEAHALVSVRGGGLCLLGLRGRFQLAGQGEGLTELVLAAGQRVVFATGLEVQVLEVQCPDAVLGLTGDGLARQLLSGCNALFVSPQPVIRPRYLPDADAYIWSTGESWRARVGEAPVVALSEGDVLHVGGRTFRAVRCPTRSADPTAASGIAYLPIRLVARYDTVHIHQGPQCVLTLSGINARLVSELAAAGAPLGWEPLAREVWPGESDRVQLRRRLDTALSRLRGKLRGVGVRPDLLHTDGCGHVELLLLRDDELVDET